MISTIKKSIIRRNAKIKHYKHSALDELPTSNEGNFTTVNKCALSDKKTSNQIPVERTKSQKYQSKEFQGTHVRESAEKKVELASPTGKTTEEEKNIFCVNFLSFLDVLHLPSFLQHKLLINFHQKDFKPHH